MKICLKSHFFKYIERLEPVFTKILKLIRALKSSNQDCWTGLLAQSQFEDLRTRVFHWLTLKIKKKNVVLKFNKDFYQLIYFTNPIELFANRAIIFNDLMRSWK